MLSDLEVDFLVGFMKRLSQLRSPSVVKKPATFGAWFLPIAFKALLQLSPLKLAYPALELSPVLARAGSQSSRLTPAKTTSLPLQLAHQHPLKLINPSLTLPMQLHLWLLLAQQLLSQESTAFH
jgi:hypothetical protein